MIPLKLLHLGWISNEVLLYSTRGIIYNLLRQTMMEDNIRKGTCVYIYIYVRLGHFAAQQKLAQHCKSSILYKLKEK